MNPDYDYIVGPFGARLQTSATPDAPTILPVYAWTPIALVPGVIDVIDTEQDYLGESRWLRFAPLWLWMGRLQ